jgi:hypothetical protein
MFSKFQLKLMISLVTKTRVMVVLLQDYLNMPKNDNSYRANSAFGPSQLVGQWRPPLSTLQKTGTLSPEATL